jgi:hypothetical protein
VTVLSRTGQELGRPAEERGGEGATDCRPWAGAKQVREAAAAEKKTLKDELTDEKRKAIEATSQFNTVSTGRSKLRLGDLVEGGYFGGMLSHVEKVNMIWLVDSILRLNIFHVFI